MNNILEGLNTAQKEAVECLSGPLLILAGAGSGKTKTLTHRIANLLAHGTHESQILAVTFTNKAAKEMRQRLWALSSTTAQEPADKPQASADPHEPPRTFMPYMGTFHSICVKILRIESEAAGLPRDYVIYDMDDQISLIKRIMKDLKMTDNKNLKPKSVQSIISSEKNQGNTPAEYAAKATYPNQHQIAKIFERYELEKSKNGALDFDDLLLKTLELLKTSPTVRDKWRSRFQHILIDEYQDTNTIQYQLIKLLVNDAGNICVVGDDWQSIYSWRGADFTNILNFERDFPGARVIKLEQNYRSTGNILTASQKIINHNQTRTDKTLFTEAGDGEPVEIEALSDETAEARYVALKIINLSHDYTDYSDFAVLYRTNAQSYAFEKTFVEMHLPYKIVGGVRFYDRKEIKDMLAILHLATNGHDRVSLMRVAHNVLSGIGEVSLGKILSAMDAYGGAEPLRDPDFPDVLNTAKARQSLAKLCSFIQGTSADENPGEIVRRATEYFDFHALTDDGTPSSDERMQNLEVMAATASEYANLADFLADASLMSSADEATVHNSVTLMTMHAAKGLEFPVVFVVGLEEGLFPSERTISDPASLEEERRLMYVGMTRARERLFLTYAGSRYSYGSRSYNLPSRFLTELGYTPAGVGSAGYTDRDGDGFRDFDFDFDDDDFTSGTIDPFPDDVPFYE